jgi:hypothetical protein
MPRRGTMARRTPAEWAVRIVLAILIGGLGYIACTHTLAYSLRNRAPGQAFALAPWDGRLTAVWARKMAGVDASAVRRAEADRLARRALEQDATAVAASTTLGLNAQIRGDAAIARKLLVYSGKLSRRDLLTHLWAIEDAVARDDIDGALRQYDTALRTSRTAPDILFPVLRSALPDPAIQRALVATLQRKPAWTEAFIYDASRAAPDPRATATLFRRLSQARVPISDEASAFLIGRLIADGSFDDAWAYYADIRPGSKRDGSRDANFQAELDVPSPFDWNARNEGGITTTIQIADRGGAFYFSAPSGVGGVVLSQSQMLPPGEYVLEGRTAEIDQPEVSRPYWSLICRNSGEVGRVTLPNSSVNRGEFRGRLIVPAQCPFQTLALTARSSDAVNGSAGEIRMVRLRHAPSLRHAANRNLGQD